MKANTSKIVCFSVSAVILVIVLALNIAVGIFADVLDKNIIGYKENPGSSAQRAEGAALSEQIQGEGSVLVKNDNLLPLSKEDAPKVNVFGWASTDWVIGGSGSGQVKPDNATDLLGALTLSGIEYNTELSQMYENFFGSP